MGVRPWSELGLTLTQVNEALDGRTINEAFEHLLPWVQGNASESFNEDQLAATPKNKGYRKRWIARIDDKTRPAHLHFNGQVKGVAAKFRWKGGRIGFPHDRTAPIELWAQCRCALVILPPDVSGRGFKPKTAGKLAAQVFKFNPRQLRVPRGNGELSGRWVDDPFTLLKRLAAMIDATPEETPRTAARGGGARVHLRPSTPELRKEFNAKWGDKAIPPGWSDVELDIAGESGLIARGRDSKGRRVYRYSQQYIDKQAAAKFHRVSEALKVRHKIEDATETLDGDGTAAAVRLMLQTGIRVGATDDVIGKVQTYGATTLRKHHATLNDDGSVTLAFIAKEGIPAEYQIDDPELVTFIKNRLDSEDSPESMLFETNATRTQDFLKQATGLESIKNHDLRTMLANIIGAWEVSRLGDPPPRTEQELRALRNQIAHTVSEALRNKPQQALSSYLNPALWADLTEALKEAA